MPLDQLRLFQDFSQASIDAISGLRVSIENADVAAALGMMERAETVYVIVQRRSFAVASYVPYCLARLELKCVLLDFVGGMAPQHAMTEKDLLFAVSFAPYTPEVMRSVKEVHNRDGPVLAVTDNERSPLAIHSALSFKVHDDSIRGFRPLSPSIVLVQSLVLALSCLKDRRRARKG